MNATCATETGGPGRSGYASGVRGARCPPVAAVPYGQQEPGQRGCVRMGVMEWLTGGDDSESAPVATDGLGFDDEMDDFDDADGGMDDFDEGMDGFDDAGDGMDDFDEGMDGFDDAGDGMDGFDEGMGDLDDGGGLGGTEVDPDTIAEMEDRISELENEISSTTSEMNTVREENKQIGETVEELDDTVRKLLDIYEMVTRGINPFVDDAREMGGLENEGAFGLFEMEEEAEDDLDPEVAEADAEAFFDEDFGDIDAEEEEAELAAGDELVDEEREDPGAALDDEAADETDGEEAVDDEATDETDDAGGTSFDELKSEYEENGGWDDVEDDGDDEATGGDAEGGLDAAVDEEPFDAEGIDDPDADGAFDTDGPDSESDAASDDAETVDGEESDAAGDEPAGADPDAAMDDEFVQSDPVEPEGDARDAVSDATNGTTDGHATSGQRSQVGVAAAAEVPADTDAYLARIPPKYTAESVVLEWTQFLVEVGGVVGATRALRQYREQGWITRRVERTVGEHVRNAAVAGGTEETRDLRIRDHRESLTYISRLAGDVEEARLLEELSALGGGARGIRR